MTGALRLETKTSALKAEVRAKLSSKQWFHVSFHGLMLFQVLLIWVARVLPAQDLPQHLAYITILSDPESTLFSEFYVRTNGIQSYFTTYFAAAWLAHFLTPDTAVRLLLTLYVVGIFFSFRSLVRATQPSKTPWLSLGASQIVWNPAACMGFFGFTLSIPLVIWAISLLIRLSEHSAPRGNTAWLALATMGIGSLHVLANGMLVVFGGLFFFLTPNRRRALCLRFKEEFPS